MLRIHVAEHHHPPHRRRQRGDQQAVIAARQMPEDRAGRIAAQTVRHQPFARDVARTDRALGMRQTTEGDSSSTGASSTTVADRECASARRSRVARFPRHRTSDPRSTRECPRRVRRRGQQRLRHRIEVQIGAEIDDQQAIAVIGRPGRRRGSRRTIGARTRDPTVRRRRTAPHAELAEHRILATQPQQIAMKRHGRRMAARARCVAAGTGERLLVAEDPAATSSRFRVARLRNWLMNFARPARTAAPRSPAWSAKNRNGDEARELLALKEHRCARATAARTPSTRDTVPGLGSWWIRSPRPVGALAI